MPTALQRLAEMPGHPKQSWLTRRSSLVHLLPVDSWTFRNGAQLSMAPRAPALSLQAQKPVTGGEGGFCCAMSLVTAKADRPVLKGAQRLIVWH